MNSIKIYPVFLYYNNQHLLFFQNYNIQIWPKKVQLETRTKFTVCLFQVSLRKHNALIKYHRHFSFPLPYIFHKTNFAFLGQTLFEIKKKLEWFGIILHFPYIFHTLLWKNTRSLRKPRLSLKAFQTFFILGVF